MEGEERNKPEFCLSFCSYCKLRALHPQNSSSRTGFWVAGSPITLPCPQAPGLEHCKVIFSDSCVSVSRPREPQRLCQLWGETSEKSLCKGGHGSCCPTAEPSPAGVCGQPGEPPRGQECSTSSCGCSTLHPWAQNSGGAATPRSALSCLGAVPVLWRQRGAGKVCGSSLGARTAWPLCTAQHSSHPMCLGSLWSQATAGTSAGHGLCHLCQVALAALEDSCAARSPG